MKAVLPLFVFIDACGWEIIKNDSFARSLAPNRKRLESVFGYSSACIPSILSGRWPVEHRNWCYFVYDPKHSPFRSLRPLRWLPQKLTSRRIFRRWLSKFLRVHLNFRGYFDLYNIPFKYISLYDFSEKKNPLQPGGMNRGPNIFDYLQQHSIPYHVSAPQATEQANLEALVRDIQKERIEFAFLYWPGLDGLLHRVGNRAPEVKIKLRQYEQWLENLVAISRKHYEEVRLYIFSDHGMANCDELLDLKGRVEALPLQVARDYAVVYDSTMARFWFFNDRAREQITGCLQEVPQGRILPDAELAELRALFPDRYFGELIFLVREGVLIVPSHMGERPIRGMHGYHPNDPHSYAMLCTNQDSIPDDVTAIPDIFRLMTRDAELSKPKTAAQLQSPRRSPNLYLVPNDRRFNAPHQPSTLHDMSTPLVSIIMRSFNEAWALRETLPALRAQEYQNWELIVIDSGSTDGSVELIRRANPRHFIQIQPAEYNPSRVLNHGMGLARAEFGIFLNADATPQGTGWLRSLVAALQDPKVAAAFGRQIPRPDCQAVFAHDYERCFGPKRVSTQWEHFFSMVSSGLRKDIWSQRGFLEKMQYSEDDEYTRWCRARGYRIVYCPESVVMHSHNYTAAQAYKRSFGEAKALAAVWTGNPAQMNLGRTVLLGWCNDLRRDFGFCLRNHRLNEWPHGARIRWNQRRAKLAGFREGWAFYRNVGAEAKMMRKVTEPASLPRRLQATK